MATTPKGAFLLLLLLLLLPILIFLCSCAAAAPQATTICPFERIYQFGDSIADTGNLIRKGGAASFSPPSRPPYGETYFHRPTGRCSNGLLMIDYIAMALHLPLLNPYLERNASFAHGANFAVAGSTALPKSFFDARGVTTRLSNSPLDVQLSWFRTHLNTVCGTPTECQRMLRRALFMVGEIGGNDYNYAFFHGKPIQEVRTYVPSVVGAIANAVRDVIRLGAKRIVVPGNFPIGCFPIYLTSFPNADPRAYDDMGCLRWLNEFAILHNTYLQRALALLRSEFPDVVILYGDYYGSFQSVLRRGPYIGFDRSSQLKACCGVGGQYNYDGYRQCGSLGVPVCPNPAQHLSWDGVHLTENAYYHMSQVLISDILSRIQCIW